MDYLNESGTDEKNNSLSTHHLNTTYGYENKGDDRDVLLSRSDEKNKSLSTHHLNTNKGDDRTYLTMYGDHRVKSIFYSCSTNLASRIHQLESK